MPESVKRVVSCPWAGGDIKGLDDGGDHGVVTGDHDDFNNPFDPDFFGEGFLQGQWLGLALQRKLRGCDRL